MSAQSSSHIILTAPIRAQLLRESQVSHPQECCGLLIGKNLQLPNDQPFDHPVDNLSDNPSEPSERSLPSGLPKHIRIDAIQISINRAANPLTQFEIDPALLIAAEKHARMTEITLIGYYHSHPNGDARPSAVDAKASAKDGRIWLIIAGQQIRAWHNIADGSVHESFTEVEICYGNIQTV